MQPTKFQGIFGEFQGISGCFQGVFLPMPFPEIQRCRITSDFEFEPSNLEGFKGDTRKGDGDGEKKTESQEKGKCRVFLGYFRVFSGNVRVMSASFQGVFPHPLLRVSLWTLPTSNSMKSLQFRLRSLHCFSQL